MKIWAGLGFVKDGQLQSFRGYQDEQTRQKDFFCVSVAVATVHSSPAFCFVACSRVCQNLDRTCSASSLQLVGAIFKIEACPKQGLYVKTVYVRFTIPPSTTMYDVFPLGQDSRCNILGLVLLIVL